MNHQTKPYQPTILKNLNGEDWENPVDWGNGLDEEPNKSNPIESLNDSHCPLCRENEEFDYDCVQVDGQYVSKQVKEFNRPNASQQYKDSALYVSALTPTFLPTRRWQRLLKLRTQAFYPQKSRQRSLSTTAYSCLNIGKVLEWLICSAGIPIPENLALHIFGYEKLLRWRDEGKQRYPAFELVLCVRPSREYLELSCQ